MRPATGPPRSRLPGPYEAAGPALDRIGGAGAVAVLADQLPAPAYRFGAPLAGNAARMLFGILVTSVPLPRSALSLGGCPLRAVYPMAPLARGQSLAVALSTYGDRVQVGLVTDGEALPDLDRSAPAVHDELEALQALVPVASAPVCPDRSDRCGGNRDTGAAEAVDAAQ